MSAVDPKADGSKSLADRITKEEAKEEPKEGPETKSTQEPAAESSLSAAQTDGAAELNPNGAARLQEPEHDVEVKLSDMQADPNNPLFSIKTFDDLGLKQELLNGIYALNFRKPSKIQERALPLLLHNPPVNMIGQSQSGTGKTAAFVLNILAKIDVTKLVPQALVLAPTRELARQIIGVVQTMGQFLTGLQVIPAIPQGNQRNARFEGQVIVGTPGTATDLIRRKQLSPAMIQVLVLDEADNMLDQQGMGDQCNRVKILLPKTVQVVLFSATFPDLVVDYANKFAPNANQITLRHEEVTIEGIKQLYMDCNSENHKFEVLVKLYGLMTIGSSIIFVKVSRT